MPSDTREVEGGGSLFFPTCYNTGPRYTRTHRRLALWEELRTIGCFPFTSLRRQRRRQTQQRLFTLPKSQAADVFSINGKSGNAGDTGFVD